MNKSKIARRLSSIPGFKKHGSFYVGLCNDDVLSGYCLDTTPRASYVWRFILPSFDRIEYLHLALGERILTVECDAELADLGNEVLRDWQRFSVVCNRGLLVDHLAEIGGGGLYGTWVRYLVHIRNQNFSAAGQLLATLAPDQQLTNLPLIAESFRQISQERDTSGWHACVALLESWSSETRSVYC